MVRTRQSAKAYFRLPLTFAEDPRVRCVIRKHGGKGFAILILLLTEIYRKGRYFTVYNSTLKNRIIATLPDVKPQTITSVVNICLRYGFFDRAQYYDHAVLTSYAIQRAFEKVRNRKISPDERFSITKEPNLFDRMTFAKQARPNRAISLDKARDKYLTTDSFALVCAENHIPTNVGAELVAKIVDAWRFNEVYFTAYTQFNRKMTAVLIMQLKINPL